MTRTAVLLALLMLFVAVDARADPAGNLVRAARAQIGVTVRYDPAYRSLVYPNGDVPLDRGVCTDVVVRAYRGIGIDLQAQVHEDMLFAWKAYPKIWGLKAPDANIDHRRVQNLATFFARHGQTLPSDNDPHGYRGGDIVTWDVDGLAHIGIVAERRTPAGVPFVIHNIGAGVQVEDMLFAYPITGHYRWLPKS
jgi:uncharacterized protein YijF (DUF1287 family)